MDISANVIISEPRVQKPNPLINHGPDTYLGGVLVAAFGTGVGFAVVFVALRIWTRVKILRKTGADDWTVLISLVKIFFREPIYPCTAKAMHYHHHLLFQRVSLLIIYRKYLLDPYNSDIYLAYLLSPSWVRTTFKLNSPE